MKRTLGLSFFVTAIALTIVACSNAPTAPAAPGQAALDVAAIQTKAVQDVIAELTATAFAATLPAWPTPAQPTVDVAAIQTKAAQDVVAKLTADAPTPTAIPAASPTPLASPTPEGPTNTPTLAPTPTPEFQAQTQKIGPIWNSARDESFTVEITLKNIQWSTGEGYSQPKPGNVYGIVTVRVKNLGPSVSRFVGQLDFKVLDVNGRLIKDDYRTIIRDCDFETVDLIAGGSAEGCFLFEVPSSGKVDLIYAPYQYEGLKPGRYLSFNLRE